MGAAILRSRVPEVEVKARLALVLSFVTVASATWLAAQEKTAPQNASIRKQDLKADVYFLADDLTRGRASGNGRSPSW